MAWRAVLNLFGGNLLDRAFDTVEKRIEAKTDRDRIKGEILQEHLRTRPDFMRAGGFWMMLPFVLFEAFHFGAVRIYSVFWCADCVSPQSWTIAALPAPHDQYSWIIIAALFGVVGIDRIKGRRR
ncbi:MAG: hypothetical protein AAFU41_00885 [Pseudomonadota bacterium]